MRYLTAEDIIKINVMVIGKYSPNEPVGIADPNSLRMIVEHVCGKINLHTIAAQKYITPQAA